MKKIYYSTIDKVIDDCINDRIKFINRNYREMCQDVVNLFNKILLDRNYEGMLGSGKKALAMIPFIRNKKAIEKADKYTSVYDLEFCREKSQQIVDDIKRHKEEWKMAYNLIANEYKQAFIDLTLMKIVGDFSYCFSYFNYGKSQYISDYLELDSGINIVDCGAFDGDTLREFLNCGIIPCNYYMYELDDNNYKRLVQCTKEISEKYKDIKIHPRKKGVYSSNRTLYYVSNKDSSYLVDYPTDTKVEVVALDDDVDKKIDIIKMDIEGGEVEALEGAKDIIRKDTPLLEICIYHKVDDFWRIPLLIHEINSEYDDFWIEHFTPGYNETVLYVRRHKDKSL